MSTSVNSPPQESMDAPPSRQLDGNLDATKQETTSTIDDGPYRTRINRTPTAGLQLPRTFHDRKGEVTHASAAVQAKFKKVNLF